MNIATVLFTYNRSWHTQQVLAALKQNTVLPQKLVIFQDGLKKNQEKNEWKKVNRLIHNVDWCDKNVMVAESNRGVADMIISGVNYVLQEYDAVIVLEDDCVPMPGFMTFMNQCLKKYADNSKVYSITGYDNLKGMESESDAYCIGRPSSWGWGTWKNRWKEFKKDYEIVRRLKTTAVGSRNLALWGNDLEDMLLDRVRGINDTWAAFWALTLIEKEGICIRAGKALIRNIGFDGSGLHCSKTNAFDTEWNTEVKEKYNLPEVCWGGGDDRVKYEYISAYPQGSCWTAINQGTKKEKILVYGCGQLFRTKEQEINQVYEIAAFIDLFKRGFYAGINIIKPKEIRKFENIKVLIMIKDASELDKVKKFLIYEIGVSETNILEWNM